MSGFGNRSSRPERRKVGHTSDFYIGGLTLASQQNCLPAEMLRVRLRRLFQADMVISRVSTPVVSKCSQIVVPDTRQSRPQAH